MMAGLWRQEPSGQETYVMLTTDASATMSKLHHRMPVILSREDAEKWLDPNSAWEDLEGLLKPQDGLEFYPVSNEVGSVKAHGPELIKAVKLTPIDSFFVKKAPRESPKKNETAANDDEDLQHEDQDKNAIKDQTNAVKSDVKYEKQVKKEKRKISDMFLPVKSPKTNSKRSHVKQEPK